MDFTDSSLNLVVQRVQAKPTNANFTWTAIVHAGGSDINAIKILNHDATQDYFSNVADEIMVTLTLTPSAFFTYISPNQEAIEVTIIKAPLGEVGMIGSTNTTYQSERYVATYVDRGNPLVQGTNTFNSDNTAMDLGDFVEIQFQLINVAMARMRLLPTGGVYRRMAPGDALKAILDTYSSQIKVDVSRKPLGVDMATPNNTTVKEQMIVPQGTMLIDVPKLFQEKYGIYSAGFSYYYTQDRWWLWPCYDVQRDSISGMKAIVVSVPSNRMPDLDRTFSVGGNLITILATGDKRFSDNSNTLRANQGNGVRFTDASNIMSGGVANVSGNKAYLSRGTNNTEVISTRNSSDYDNVVVSSNRVTSNPYMEYSKMAGREGSTMAFVWENADPSYLYPGMPFTYYYLDGDTIKQLQGLLMKAQNSTQIAGKGQTEIRYKTHTVITLYVKRNLETTS